MNFRASLVMLLFTSLVIGCVSCASNTPQPQSNAPATNSAAAKNSNASGATSANGNSTDAPAQSANSQSAANVVGTYRITGRNQDSSAYNGTLTITAHGPVYHLAWQSGGGYEGIGILQGNSLAAGWGGATCTVASYRVQPDGNLEGQWVTVGGNQTPVVNTERAVRSGAAAAGGEIAGDYNVTGSNPDGTQYRGTLRVTQRGSVYQFSWNTGNAFEGVGIRQGDTIAVGWGTQGCGVANYQITNDGLRGVWGVYGRNQSGREEVVRQ